MNEFVAELIAGLSLLGSKIIAGISTVLTVISPKFVPAGIGAAIMVVFDPPVSKRELFARAFVAFAMSYLFGDVVFDFMRATSTFAFLDPGNSRHHTAVDGMVGAFGFAVMAGASEWLKKLKADPVKTIEQVKKDLGGQ